MLDQHLSAPHHHQDDALEPAGGRDRIATLRMQVCGKRPEREGGRRGPEKTGGWPGRRREMEDERREGQRS